MGYNISEVSGTFTPTVVTLTDIDGWTFDADLSSPSVTSVSGNFNVVSALTGTNQGEATNGYTFSALSSNAWGSLSFNTTNGTFTFTINRAAVIASGSNQVVSFTVTGRSGTNTDTDTVTINILICLARGTKVATPDGEVAVECLSPGDRVLTSDGRVVPVRWIGARRLSAADLAREPDLRPVLIRRDAFGPGRPARDLRVSPQHRIEIGDWRSELYFAASRVLVPAKGLVNGTTVLVDRAPGGVEYFHVLCDGHEVILTDGLPTETFYPGPYTLSELDEPVREELLRLFPELCEGGMEPARPGVRPWEARLLRDGQPR